MALITCPECSGNVSDKADACIHCGYPLASATADQRIINGQVVNLQEIIDFFGEDQISATMELVNRAGITGREARLIMEEEYRRKNASKNDTTNEARCPKCGSTSLSANKKGFGFGKAVVGAIVAGPIGLAAGGIGAGKVIVTCLSCKHQFKI